MKVKEVKITGFGKFRNQTFRFNESLNIVQGLNEAGKTTLVNAILGVLYGFKGRSEEMRLLKEKYRPWDQSIPYRASVIVNFGDEYDICIERNFDEDKTRLSRLEDGYVLPYNLSIEKLLSERLGLTNGKLFKSTLLVKQDEVADLHKTELAEAISRKITESGSEVSVKEILRILADRLKELHRGFGRQTPNPGPIKTCMEEIKKLKIKLEEAGQYYQEYNELLREFHNRQEEKERLQQRLQEIRPLLTDFEKYQDNFKELEAMRERLAQLRATWEKSAEKEAELNTFKTILSLYNEKVLTIENLQLAEFLDRKLAAAEQMMEQVNQEFQKKKEKRQLIQREMGNYSKRIGSYPSVKYNEINLAEARRLRSSIISLQEELAEKELRQKEFTEARQSRFSWKFWVGAAFCALSAAGLFAGGIWGYVASGVSMITGIMLIFLGGLNSSYRVTKELLRITQVEIERARDGLTVCQGKLDEILEGENMETFESKVRDQLQLKQKLQRLEEEFREIDLDPLEDELNSLRQDTGRYLQQLNAILMEAKVDSIEEFREKLDELKSLKADIKLCEDTLAFLKNNKQSAEIGYEIEELEGKIHQLEAESDKHIIPKDQYELIKQEVEELEGHFAIAKEAEIKIAAGVENYDKLFLQERDLWALESALAEKEAELRQLEIESKSIELAVTLVQESTEEARARLAPQVKDKAAKIFQWITQKKYQDVRLEMDGDQLVFQYLDNEYNQYRDLHYLSSGTRDQLYLALRIALGEYLTKGPTFPVFLDDPFVNFDNHRLSKTIEILRILSREHQIILLTKDYDLADDIAEAAIIKIN